MSQNLITLITLNILKYSQIFSNNVYLTLFYIPRSSNKLREQATSYVSKSEARLVMTPVR